MEGFFLSMKQKKIGVLTSGGDAPGMNAAIRALVRTCVYNNIKVTGIKRGYEGLLTGDILELTARSVSDTIHRGGTILLTARCPEMLTQEGQEKAAQIYKILGLDALVVIGGDGSLTGGLMLSRLGVNIIGIPGTIDMDLPCTEYTIGFDTAVNTGMDAINKIRDTSTSHERCSVVEVMGRNAGNIALWCAMTGGAEDVLLPEMNKEENNNDTIIKQIIENRAKGKTHNLILVAEGAGGSAELAAEIKKVTGIESRATVLGHLQRGGSPTAVDRMHASMMGHMAVEIFMQGLQNKVIIFKNSDYTYMDIEEALACKRGEQMKRTKILATLGPASNDVETIKDLIRAGMDAARINFSHGTYESHAEIINKLKQAREELKAPIPLILDTKGPEIRIKTFKEDKIFLEQGSKFTLTTRDIVGDNTIVAVTYENLPKDLEIGSRVLIDDGLIELKVINLTDEDIECNVINSGFLSSRKGVNVPDVYVNLPSLTDKDIDDIKFGIKMGFDYIAASFIRCANDVIKIKEILEENNAEHINVIAKIESRDGVNNIESILEMADGIMVARGDLGVEIPPEEVPVVQKMLINKSNIFGKPVITATQMLESMVSNPRPTRAEANDVANAILDGSDSIMLSGETASGKYPVESVKMMARIAIKAEESIDYYDKLYSHNAKMTTKITNAISYAACTTAADLKAACIVTVTNSGFTARKVSKFRPPCPIVAVTFEEDIWRQLNLLWGCVPTMTDADKNLFSVAVIKSQETGVAKTGDPIVIAAGVPVGMAGTTNTLRVQIVGDVLVKGRAVGDRILTGRTNIMRVAEAIDKEFKKGDILVVTKTNNEMMPYIKRASAIIVGSGQKTDHSHTETVAKALDIPVIICEEKVVELLQDNMIVRVDCSRGFVFNESSDKYEDNI
ncbi:pyruvate kinase [Holotrichia oblita]|nr:pyruvate kinase [Holotrichia oblita]